MKRFVSSLLIAAACLSASAEIIWHSADTLPLLGKAIDDASAAKRYQRLPDSLESKVKRPALFGLGKNTAGMAVRFASNSPSIGAKWQSSFKNMMNHQTPTGTRGLDLYMLQPDGTWTFANSARPDINNKTTATNIIANMDPEWREYLLYLSLYDGIDSLFVGVEDGYELRQPSIALPSESRPVIMYGTSILQGGCANRPGMAHTNILERRLNREVINLGFSGNGQLDLEVAEVIAAVPDPGLIVLDFVPNVNEAQIDTLMIPFFEIIRSAHPEVPFIFVEDPDFPHKRFDKKAREQVDRRNAMMKERYEKLAAKYGNLHYVPADLIIGTDHEATVDGIHFTDLGFVRFADHLEPLMRRVMLPAKTCSCKAHDGVATEKAKCKSSDKPAKSKVDKKNKSKKKNK